MNIKEQIRNVVETTQYYYHIEHRRDNSNLIDLCISPNEYENYIVATYNLRNNKLTIQHTDIIIPKWEVLTGFIRICTKINNLTRGGNNE